MARVADDTKKKIDDVVNDLNKTNKDTAKSARNSSTPKAPSSSAPTRSVDSLVQDVSSNKPVNTNLVSMDYFTGEGNKPKAKANENTMSVLSNAKTGTKNAERKVDPQLYDTEAIKKKTYADYADQQIQKQKDLDYERFNYDEKGDRYATEHRQQYDDIVQRARTDKAYYARLFDENADSALEEAKSQRDSLQKQLNEGSVDEYGGNGYLSQEERDRIRGEIDTLDERISGLEADAEDRQVLYNMYAYDNATEENRKEINTQLGAYYNNFGERLITSGEQLATDIINIPYEAVDWLKELDANLGRDRGIKDLDEQLAKGKITQEQYDAGVADLDAMVANASHNQDDNYSKKLKELAENYTQQTYMGTGEVERFILEGVGSTAQFLTHYALFGPAMATITMGASSAVDRTNQLLDEGYDYDTAYKNGVITGVISYVVEKVGMDRFVDIVSGTSAPMLLGNLANGQVAGLGYVGDAMARSALGEGLEEGWEGLMDAVADSITLGTPIQIDGKELIRSMLLGGFSGGLMGMSGGVNAVINTKAQYNMVGQELDTLRSALAIETDERTRQALQRAIETGEGWRAQYENKSQLGDAVQLSSEETAPTSTPSEDLQSFFQAMTPAVNEDLNNTIKTKEAGLNVLRTAQADLDAKGINARAEDYFKWSPETQQKVAELQPKANKAFPHVHVFFDSTIGQNGEIDFKLAPDGKPIITLNPNATDIGMGITAIHEALHSIQGSEEFNKLVDLAYPGEDGAKVLLEDMRKLAHNQYADYTDEQLLREAVVKKISEQFLNSPSVMDRLARVNTNVAYKMFYALKDAVDLNTDGDTTVTEMTRLLEDALNKQPQVYFEDGTWYDKKSGSYYDTVKRIFQNPDEELRGKDRRYAVMLKPSNYSWMKKFETNAPTLVARGTIESSTEGISKDYEHSYHNPISQDVMENLDVLMEDPLAVFESRTNKGVDVYTVFLKATDTKGYPIMAVLSPVTSATNRVNYYDLSMNPNYRVGNYVLSVYGKDYSLGNEAISERKYGRKFNEEEKADKWYKEINNYIQNHTLLYVPNPSSRVMGYNKDQALNSISRLRSSAVGKTLVDPTISQKFHGVKESAEYSSKGKLLSALENNEQYTQSESTPEVVNTDGLTTEETADNNENADIVSRFVTVAPLFNTQVNEANYEEVVGPLREEFKSLANDVVGMYGGKVKDIVENIGGYTNDSGEIIREPSFTVEVEGLSFEDTKLLASLFGDLTKENQESVIAYEYAPIESADAVEYTIQYNGDHEQVRNILGKYGINDFTQHRDSNTVALLDFEKTDNYEESIQNAVNELIEGGLYVGIQSNPVVSSLINREDRQLSYQQRLGAIEARKQEGVSDNGRFEEEPIIRRALENITNAMNAPNSAFLNTPLSSQQEAQDTQDVSTPLVTIEQLQSLNIPDLQKQTLAEIYRLWTDPQTPAERRPMLLETYNDLLRDYGAIPQGEGPRNDFEVPRQTDNGTVSRFARTIAEAPNALNEDLQDDFRAQIAEDRFTYTPVSNQSLVDNANFKIEKLGEESSLKQFMSRTSYDSNTVALGEVLLTRLGQRGDPRALDVARKLTEMLSETGRTLQSARILKRLTPEGQYSVIESQISKIQDSLNERFGNDAPEIEVPENLRQEFFSATSNEARDAVKERIMQSVIDQTPATWQDKANTIRYLAMLGNVRTHIRNVLGNALFAPIVSTKNAIASAGESLYSNTISKNAQSKLPDLDEQMRLLNRRVNEAEQGSQEWLDAKKERDKVRKQRNRARSLSMKERTKSVVNPFSAEGKRLIDFGKAQYDANHGNLKNTANIKYALENTMQGKQAFSNKNPFGRFINRASKLNSDALGLEDNLFKKSRYASSMAEWMQANGVTPDTITKSQLNKANDYAWQECLKATYNDYNVVADHLNKLSQKSGVARFFKDAVVPFTTTPFNIVKRGVEYSPLGLAKTMSKGIYDLNKGKITANEFIDNIASGLTGSGVFALGALLASLGIFRTKDDDPERKQSFDEALGDQDYAIVTDNGSYTIDWAQPVIMPLAMGAELYKAVSDLPTEDGFNPMEMITSVSSRIMDPIVETSMMSGVKSSLSSYANGGGEWIGDIVANTIANYVGQFFPTFGSQIARSVDPTRRTTYPNSGWLEKTARQLANKVPFVSEQDLPIIGANQPLLNAKGEDTLVENMGSNDINGYLSNLTGQDVNIPLLGRVNPGALLLNMVSPGYVSTNRVTANDEELYRLYDSTGNVNAFPNSMKKTFTYQGTKYELTGSEYTEFNRDMLQMEEKYVNDFMNSDQYDDMSDEERMTIITSLRDFCYSKAKSDYLKQRGIKYVEKDRYSPATFNDALDVLNKGYSLTDYFMANEYKKNIKSDDKKAEFIDYLNSTDMPMAEKNAIYDSQYGDSKFVNAINSTGLTDEQKIAIKMAYETKADSNDYARKLKQMGVFDYLVKYCNDNGLEYSDVGLNKTTASGGYVKTKNKNKKSNTQNVSTSNNLDSLIGQINGSSYTPNQSTNNSYTPSSSGNGSDLDALINQLNSR